MDGGSVVINGQNIETRSLPELLEALEMTDGKMRNIQAEQLMLKIMRDVRTFNRAFTDRWCDVRFTLREESE